MASKTDEANWALYKLGESRVSNIETESVEKARVINQLYDLVRNSLLQKYPWNFCLKRVSLAPDSVAPTWGYAYAYSLPSDYLATREIYNDPKYVVEGSKILTDEGPTIYLRYHAKVTDISLDPPLFVEAFAAKLAFEACERVTNSNVKKESLYQQFQIAISEAYIIDAIEGSAEELDESDWIAARS